MSPTVFVVDDDEQMRESLQALLSELGYEVSAFSTPMNSVVYFIMSCVILVCSSVAGGVNSR